MEIAARNPDTFEKIAARYAVTNDNKRPALSFGHSIFPEDAIARISRPSRPVTTSAPARHEWKLVFELRNPSFIEPLMGYTGGRDTVKQVELRFPTLGQAIRYAERQGLQYRVQTMEHERNHSIGENRRARRSFSDSTLDRLGLSQLSENYGRAMTDAANRSDPEGSANWASPMGVVADRDLPLDAKRSILMNWAYTEYLIDQATNEGMPEYRRPSRLDEVEQALLALERDVSENQSRQKAA